MEQGKLVVIAERKFNNFFKKPDRFEASDLIYNDGFLYVVFDNLYQIAKIRLDLDPKKGERTSSARSKTRSRAMRELHSIQNQTDSMRWLSALNIPISITKRKCTNTIVTLRAEPTTGGSPLTSNKIATRV